ncbi:hypothetical protein CCR95_05670 [Thiocystis minor]|uniref:PAS domain-containing protein n=1 Tax=Thiocystis minor TaxID=61597 RepID=UPI0019114C52|nr:PAS domain-containing protein [Thiocystis minor]MBK5963590.1 hypothetical protein [Thiocystis minor]
MNGLSKLAASELAELLLREPGVGRCLVAPDGRVLRANDEWLRSTGLKDETAIGADIVALFPDTRDMSLAMHARARAGHHVEVPRHVQRLQGRDTCWEGSLAPVPMEDGIGLLITAREVPLPDSAEAAPGLPSDPPPPATERASLCAAVLAGRELRYTYVNEGYRRLAPDTPMLGCRFRDVFPDAAASDFEERFLRVIETGETWSIDGYRAPIPSDPEATWDGEAVRLPTPEGEAPSVAVFVVNVSDRLCLERALSRREEELRQAQDRFRQTIERISDGLLVLDRDWRYTVVSERATQILGIARERLLGGCVWELFPHALGTKFHEGYQRAMETGEPVHFEEYYPAPLEMWIECHCYPAPDALTVYFRDVTDYRRVNDALRESEARLQLGLRVAGMGLAEIDYATGTCHLTAKAAQLYGLGEDALSVPRETVHATFHPQERGRLHALIAACLDPSGPGFFDLDHRVVLPGGQIRWLRVRKQVSFDGQEPARAMLAAFDVTPEHTAADVLRDGERFKQAVLDAMPSEVAVLDRDGVIVAVNAPWQCFALENGPRPGETAPRTGIGTNYLEICDTARGDSAAGADGTAAGIRAVMSGATAQFNLDYLCHAPDQVFWYALTVNPLQREDGSVVVVHTNITERKAAEEALRKSEERLRRIAQAGRIGFVEWNAARDTAYWSPEHYALFGFEPDLPISWERWFEGVHPDDRERVAQNAARLLERARAQGQVVGHKDEYRFIRPDRTLVWLEADVSVDMVAGEPIVRSAVREVTERKHAEDARRQALAKAEAGERMLATLLANVPEGITVCDADGNLRLVSQHGQDLLGAPHADKRIAEVVESWTVYRPDGQTVMPVDELPLLRALKGETVRDAELVQLNEDGRRLFLLCNAAPIHDSGERVVGAIGTWRDIGERKAAEAALREADRRKDAFLATLGHELRNPLAPIRNACAILTLAGGSDPRVAAARDLIDRQVSHLVRLVDDLLDVSRITRGKLALQRERVGLATVLEHGLEVARPLIKAAGQQLSVSIPPEPIAFEADPVRLAQVFANLLNNASKYTPAGGAIRLTATRTAGEVVVEVTDTGIGIPAEHLPRLFELFHQVPTDVGRVQTGLGIGLALAQGLVAMHEGQVSAHSNGPGTGSTFRVRLPVVSARPVAPAQSPPSLGRLEGRVLVVDDQTDVAESLAMLLDLQGVTVRTAADGLEALAVAERFRPDLVLLDLGMPKLDGFETCRQLRAKPWGQALAIVAITGWGQEQDRQRSAAAGFDDHWTKPVECRVVLERLAAIRARGRS